MTRVLFSISDKRLNQDETLRLIDGNLYVEKKSTSWKYYIIRFFTHQYDFDRILKVFQQGVHQIKQRDENKQDCFIHNYEFIKNAAEEKNTKYRKVSLLFQCICCLKITFLVPHTANIEALKVHHKAHLAAKEITKKVLDTTKKITEREAKFFDDEWVLNANIRQLQDLVHEVKNADPALEQETKNKLLEEINPLLETFKQALQEKLHKNREPVPVRDDMPVVLLPLSFKEQVQKLCPIGNEEGLMEAKKLKDQIKETMEQYEGEGEIHDEYLNPLKLIEEGIVDYYFATQNLLKVIQDAIKELEAAPTEEAKARAKKVIPQDLRELSHIPDWVEDLIKSLDNPPVKGENDKLAYREVNGIKHLIIPKNVLEDFLKNDNPPWKGEEDQAIIGTAFFMDHLGDQCATVDTLLKNINEALENNKTQKNEGGVADILAALGIKTPRNCKNFGIWDSDSFQYFLQINRKKFTEIVLAKCDFVQYK